MIHFIKKWLASTDMTGLRQSQTSASETDKSNSLSIEREPIEDTPFIVVGTTKHGYWLAMGKHRLSQAFKSIKEAKKYAMKKDWTLISAMMIALVHDRKTVDKIYSMDTATPPEEKSVQLSMELNNKQ